MPRYTQLIPTKWRTYRDHRFRKVISPCILRLLTLFNVSSVYDYCSILLKVITQNVCRGTALRGAAPRSVQRERILTII